MRRAAQLERLRGLGRFLAAAQPSATATQYAQMIAQAAARYGVPAQLALAVAQKESGLRNEVNVTSGAAGIMQLMPATAKSLGVTNVMDPAQNIDAGVRYLGMMLAQFGGDPALAVAAYDWGPGNVARAQQQYGDQWLSAAPAETQNYVAALGLTPAPAQQPTVTLDASTGDVVPEQVDLSTLAPLNAPPDTLLLAAAAVAGFFLLRELMD